MSVLQEAIKQGIEFEVNGDRLKVRSTKPIPPDLVEQLRAHKQEIIHALRKQTKTDEYAKGTAHKYQSKGQGEKNDSEAYHKAEPERRYCEGYQPARYVHADVCRRHIEKCDAHCVNCQHLGMEEKQIWMNACLDGAIARLNTFYSHGDRIDWDRPGARKEIDRLEKAITEAFLQGDIQGYVDTVDKWENLFRDTKVPLRADNSNDIKK